VVIWDDLDNSGQRWYIYEALDGKYVLRPACSADCVLDVFNLGTDNDTNIQICQYNGYGGQLFTFTDVGCAHEWEEATCTTAKVCKICGTTEGTAPGHVWTEATCTAPRTCQTCGAVEGELGHDFNDYQVCRKCMKLRTGQIAGIYGFNISLGGNIAVNFYMVLDDAVVNDENAKVVFTVPNSGTAYKLEIPISQAQKVGNLYMFTCEIAAKEITSEIVTQVTITDAESAVFRYPLIKYAETILANQATYAAESKVVKAMLNYSAAAQIYFGHNTGNLANDSAYIRAEDKILADVDLRQYAEKLSGEQAGVSFHGASLSLESETAIKLYFIIEGNADEIPMTVNGKPVTAVRNGGYYEIKISDIAAHQLGNVYEIKVGGLTLHYGAFSYGNKAMGTANEALKNTVRALYAYYQAAMEYKTKR
jgi:hypothetical protein